MTLAEIEARIAREHMTKLIAFSSGGTMDPKMDSGAQVEALLEVVGDNKLLEVGRKAIEDALVDFRNSRLSQPMRNNGLVIKEEDGKSSSVIRFGAEYALSLALKAIAEHLKAQEQPSSKKTSK